MIRRLYTSSKSTGGETPGPVRPLIRVSLPRVSGCVVALITLCWAQEPSNPYDTPEGVEQGAALFQTHCSYCHGARGEGGRGADLTTGQYRHGGLGANLDTTHRKGIHGTQNAPRAPPGDEEGKER